MNARPAVEVVPEPKPKVVKKSKAKKKAVRKKKIWGR